MKTITLGVSGSVAAHKAGLIAEMLTQAGYNVRVAMTPGAAAFITPLTLEVVSRNHVYSVVTDEYVNGKVAHVDLAQSCDLFLIVPASANTIGKIANGIADSMLTAIASAVPVSTPKLFAPAMNDQMYANPAVAKNIDTLKERGYQIIEPQVGILASGKKGNGNLADFETILTSVRSLLSD
ncbi:MAG: phosphopantothenoylcysteine decarboxylase [Lactobacillales bacterium]|jgi:phosphopantothenoylcysteine decarboxylase|nr:phosphopantothenoylcysteine decarboxylase [Lactobacillales bacterium]